jgi:LysM repeat protein
MAIELTKDLLKVDQIVGESESQALVEGDIIIPESKGDILEILDISGDVFVSSRQVIQDKVMLEGVIRYNVLYIAEGDNPFLESVDSEVGFTHYLDIPDVKPSMMSVLSLDLEHVDYTMVNSRKIIAKAVLIVGGQVKQVAQLEAIKGLDGLDDVQELKDKIQVSISGEMQDSQAMIREDLELDEDMPSIRKILRKTIKVKVLEKEVADNRVAVHGEIDVGVLYQCADDEEPVHYFKQDIPFNHYVEVPGAYQGMDCTVDAGVQDFYVGAREDINGELRFLNIEAVLVFKAQVIETVERELIIDVYSPSKVLNLKKEKIKTVNQVAGGQSQSTVKEQIVFPEGAPEASRIFAVEPRAVITDQRIEDEKVVIEGVLETQIVYQAQREKTVINSIREEIPFSQSVEIKGIDETMDCQSQLNVESTSFSLTAPNEVELRVVVSAAVSVSAALEKQVIVDIQEAEDQKADDSGIYIYFIQPGDTLWNVAKKYNTTVASIVKFNNLDSEEALEPGNKLVIYKKLTFKAG